MTKTYRWGILGTGKIAHKLAQDLKLVPEAQLVAVGSRSQASADEFGAQYDIPNRHATYEGLANDPDVDVIYIATPHVYHKENSLLCLNAGKHVLCEKAFTINAHEAKEVITLARQKKLFIMDAIWSRFMPSMYELRRIIHEGIIGEVQAVTATFGFRAPSNPDDRLLNPALGGGTLLDIGVYPIQLAFMVYGEKPQELISTAYIGQTGVDERTAIIFRYSGGRMANLSTSFTLQMSNDATIYGTKGYVHIHAPFWHSQSLSLYVTGQNPHLISAPLTGFGYTHEIMEVHACLDKGQIESQWMPLDETLAIMETMDALRAQWGLKYPQEK
jgi:predicted dehydrogenase